MPKNLPTKPNLSFFLNFHVKHTIDVHFLAINVTIPQKNKVHSNVMYLKAYGIDCNE